MKRIFGVFWFNPTQETNKANRGVKFIALSRFAFLLAVLLFYSCQQKNKELLKPNVLFIAIDDLNDWTGFLGGHPQAHTPQMDKLASSSIVFRNAYCSGPACGPSRTSLLYGIQPYKSRSYGHHDVYNPKNMDVFTNLKSLPAVFREHGYYTAGCGKIDHYQVVNNDFEIYFKSPNDRVFPDPDNPETVIPKGGRPISDFQIGPISAEDELKMHDRQYAEWAAEKLKQKHDRPFFLAVGFEKPHLPWVAPQEYFNKFDLDSIILPDVPEGDLDDTPEMGKIFAHNIFGFFHTDPDEHSRITGQPDMWKQLVRAYLASSAHTDAMVGKVVNALMESEYRDNTIIILWSDHGWHLGEKEHWRKMTLWEQGTRTPLIINLPANNKFEAVSTPVSLLDIYPTLTELCGFEKDQPKDGHSLVPLIKNPECDWEHPAIMTHGPGNFAVCYKNWRYIQYYDGGEELYNEANDPDDYNNLIGIDTYNSVAKELRQYTPKEYKKVLGPRFMKFYED
ncbi:sulfatase [Prolixibacteraceae bacterium Z1-6]|uniref:Sulfatase n=1 Tax=Draconibacterium aestuarii TaxID=2998507 RepID=A0A9X3FBA6_9BACT|nr:sulfatase [Prolixibacteraceae bacterium Z1-6]